MDQFLGELRMFGFRFAPRGWALCQGQTLAIGQNLSLYSLLGITYGGDGRTNFKLPDLRGRAPVHRGGTHLLGSKTGVEAVTLLMENVPPHGHVMNAASATRAESAVRGSFAEPVASVGAIYAPAAATTTLRAESVSTTGGAAHENMQPFLTINWAIALEGQFPARS